MTTHEQIINYTIKPHGGTLINRVVEGEERDASFRSSTII